MTEGGGRTLYAKGTQIAPGTVLRYSRFVGLAKLILPMTAGLLIVALGAWPIVSDSISRIKSGMTKFDIAQVRDLRMVNARYSGIDKEKRPFTLTANTARQTTGDASAAAGAGGGDLVALDVPRANLLTHQGVNVIMTSETGMYQTQTHFLDLFGNVTLLNDKGYKFRTHSARVDFDAGTAEGHEPIDGAGPSGTISGEGFKVLDKGDSVLFTGKSKVVLNTVHHGGGK